MPHFGVINNTHSGLQSAYDHSQRHMTAMFVRFVGVAKVLGRSSAPLHSSNKWFQDDMSLLLVLINLLTSFTLCLVVWLEAEWSFSSYINCAGKSRHKRRRQKSHPFWRMTFIWGLLQLHDINMTSQGASRAILQSSAMEFSIINKIFLDSYLGNGAYHRKMTAKSTPRKGWYGIIPRHRDEFGVLARDPSPNMVITGSDSTSQGGRPNSLTVFWTGGRREFSRLIIGSATTKVTPVRPENFKGRSYHRLLNA